MLQKQWLSTQTPELVESFLRANSLLSPREAIASLEPAGEGNMNVTLRVTIASSDAPLDRRSLIVKQSRPYVAKYDSIPAPLERIEHEAAFYEFAGRHAELSIFMPRLIAWIPEQHALVIEDLGCASDATSFYDQFPLAALPTQLPELVNWLRALHSLSRGQVDNEQFRNTRLRKLNHQHIFDIPFQESPAIDLDSVCPGLASASAAIRCDTRLRDRSLQLGELYLAQGDCLLHGDFYPGSWLLTTAGPRIIDPEFCFVGPAEFDLGVLLAHLQIIGCTGASEALSGLLTSSDHPPNWNLVEAFAAIEVLRRLLGVAQLPISLDLEQRMTLIESSVPDPLN